ncbi:hypothetical protein BDV35DRAFT_343951 [Aspergillus flavus]|uniref:Uncharacterized protein n=1 Tax=Aspergillus flavus TaxID=5059 RepID=A0A5N6H6D8_ASPFL|nr:hypothetical protein BDV35DRAFT_343951 [Aspergillus flavus]
MHHSTAWCTYPKLNWKSIATAPGAYWVALSGWRREHSYIDPATISTANSIAEPSMRHLRRPRRSTICALIMIPVIPIVFKPPVNPFNLILL